MKKQYRILVLLVLCLLLAACGKNPEAEIVATVAPTAAPTEAPTDPPTEPPTE